MNSSLLYTGKVSITVGKKRATAYNNGTNTLFQLFARALVGDKVHDAHPTHFKIVSGNDVVSVAIQRKEVVNTIPATARFAGYVTTAISKAPVIQIHLCHNAEEYASLNLTEGQIDTLTQITAEKSALIEWDLTVSNKTYEE